MSGDGEDTRGEGDDVAGPPFAGRRKDGREYRGDNLREDGSYKVGKGRPPVRGQFAVADGRKRGRRAKGVQNADTRFTRELNRPATVKEKAGDRKVTKSHAVDVRLINNAMKGDNRAIEMVDQRRRRIAEAAELNQHSHNLSDQALLEAFFRERAQELAMDPAQLGDAFLGGASQSAGLPPAASDDENSGG